MRNPLTSLFVVVLLASSAVAQPTEAPAKIAKLIDQLGSPEFALRETATQELASIGEPALPALTKATALMLDMEVTQRATELIVTIQKQLETDRLLAPTLVELSFVNKPLVDVFRELEKQSGYQIQYLDPKLLLQTVSMKTGGKVPFWNAVDGICTVAKLDASDANLVNVFDHRILALEAKIREAMQQNAKGDPDALRDLQSEHARVLQLAKLLWPSSGIAAKIEMPRRITFRTSTGTALPKSVQKAVYVECLPYPAAGIKDQLLTLLQVTQEAKVQLLRVESVRITKAVDDKAQALNSIPTIAPIVAATPDPNARFNQGRARVIVIDADGVVVPPAPAAPFTLLPAQAIVRFACSEKQTSQVKELQGLVRATVRTPQEVFASVTDLDTTPTGKATGSHGVTIKVTKLQTAESMKNSVIDLVTEFTMGEVQFGDVVAPFDPNDLNLLQNGGLRGGRGRGQVRPDEVFNSKYSCLNGLKVLDKNNQPFEIETTLATRSFTQGGRVAETIKLMVTPTDKTQGSPVTLTVGGTRTRIVEIPFQLTNVPVVSAPHE